MVGEKLNPQILVNLPVTIVPRCSSSSAKTFGLKDLQLPNMAASSGPPDGARIVHQGADGLFVEHDSIPDGEATLLQERTQHFSLWAAFSLT